MEARHWMEIWMTLALICYFAAYFVAKKDWEQHLVFATVGFLADMRATYLMMQVGLGTLSGKTGVHTLLALVAILAFFIQAWLGYKAKWGGDYHQIAYRHMHVRFAKFAFLPIWVVAYLSGLILPFL